MKYWYIFISLLLFGACSPENLEVPELQYLSMNQQIVAQNGAENVTLQLYFKTSENNILDSLWIWDARTGEVVLGYELPVITTTDGNNILEGSLDVEVASLCCNLDNTLCLVDSTKVDSAQYMIAIQSFSGVQSLPVYSDFVQLRCY